jgi:pimeloyl-ACP methyl ester carboxylesterase
VQELEQINNKKYERIQINTSLGKTNVWALTHDDPAAKALVIFPGARTTALFWDFDNALKSLGVPLKIYMVETNGLPNLSDGKTPDIKSNGYGIWANEVLNALSISSAFIAGASFGGLVAMKFALTNPEKIKAAFLLNPGCLQPFSLSLKNLYYNLLPIVSPTPKNVTTFLVAAVFCRPTHQLSPACEKLIIDYEVFALKQYNDKTQKPYYMNDELKGVTVDTYVLEGDKDLLFPYEKSITNARLKLGAALKDVKVFKNVGHGIETFKPALSYVGEIIKRYQ